MTLPRLQVSRAFDLDTEVTVLTHIVLKFVGRDQVWMTVVISILDQPFAVLWKTGTHELANDAAEVGWHQHCLEPGKLAYVHLAVDEFEKVQELLHDGFNMAGRTAERDNTSLSEAVRVEWKRSAGASFRVIRHANFEMTMMPHALSFEPKAPEL